MPTIAEMALMPSRSGQLVPAARETTAAMEAPAPTGSTTIARPIQIIQWDFNRTTTCCPLVSPWLFTPASSPPPSFISAVRGRGHPSEHLLGWALQDDTPR